MARKPGEALAAALLLVLAVGYLVEARRLPGVKYAVGPGPAFLPLLLGAALAALSLALLIQAVRRPGGPGPPTQPRTLWRVGVILLSVLGYAVLLERLGYVVSTALFLAVLLALVEPQRWWVVLTVPLITTGLSWLLFVRLLRIPFPRGPWGF